MLLFARFLLVVLLSGAAGVIATHTAFYEEANVSKIATYGRRPVLSVIQFILLVAY